jgi:hypothetical protein
MAPQYADLLPETLAAVEQFSDLQLERRDLPVHFSLLGAHGRPISRQHFSQRLSLLLARHELSLGVCQLLLQRPVFIKNSHCVLERGTRDERAMAVVLQRAGFKLEPR